MYTIRRLFGPKTSTSPSPPQKNAAPQNQTDLSVDAFVVVADKPQVAPPPKTVVLESPQRRPMPLKSSQPRPKLSRKAQLLVAKHEQLQAWLTDAPSAEVKSRHAFVEMLSERGEQLWLPDNARITGNLSSLPDGIFASDAMLILENLKHFPNDWCVDRLVCWAPSLKVVDARFRQVMDSPAKQRLRFVCRNLKELSCKNARADIELFETIALTSAQGLECASLHPARIGDQTYATLSRDAKDVLQPEHLGEIRHALGQSIPKAVQGTPFAYEAKTRPADEIIEGYFALLTSSIYYSADTHFGAPEPAAIVERMQGLLDRVAAGDESLLDEKTKRLFERATQRDVTYTRDDGLYMHQETGTLFAEPVQLLEALSGL